jgi:CBS domain-containing protein
MLTTDQRLAETSAEDLMSRDVITIPQPMSLRAAAHRLAQSGISGAPVVDEYGRCVGMISATDMVRFLDRSPCSVESEASPGFCSDWQVLDVEQLPVESVATFMSTDLVTAPPNLRVPALARLMLEARVHRVLVIDEQRRPLGLVSSTDVLRAVARLESP